MKSFVAASLWGIRENTTRMSHKEAATKLFKEVAPRYMSFDKGGYTRIVKLGVRAGDGSEMAVVQLIEK